MVQPLSRINLALNRNPGSSIPFSPDDLTGLQLWLDAQDEATVFFDSGTRISRWDDKSANTNNATPVSTATAPELITVAGRKMVEFDGVDEFIKILGPANLDFGSGDFTIIAVYRSADVNHGQIWDHRSGATHIAGRVNQDDLDDGDFAVSFSDGTNTAALFESDQTFNDNAVRVAQQVRDGSNMRLYMDNVETTASPVDSSSVGDTDLTAPWTFGAFNQGASRFLNGEIGEILIYDRALTTGERLTLDTFLAAKWGI